MSTTQSGEVAVLLHPEYIYKLDISSLAPGEQKVKIKKHQEIITRQISMRHDLKFFYEHVNIMAYVFYQENESNENLPTTSWGATWGGVRRSMRHLKTPESVLRKYLEWAGFFEDSFILELIHYPLNRVLPVLEKLTVHLKMNSDLMPLEWIRFCELTILSGYPEMKNREMKDDPFKWLEQPVESQVDRTWWKASFIKTYDLFSRPISKRFVNLQQFVLSRWKWTTDGATSLSNLYLNGEKIKTKFGAAVSLSDDELLSVLSKPSDIGVFLKGDEKGYKRRLIANVPMRSYLACAHILEFFLSSTRGDAPWIGTTDLTIDGILDIILTVRGGYCLIPLDESAYDYHVTAEQWEGFISFAERFSEISEAVAILKADFGSQKWSFLDKKGTWKKGMPSGLTITTFLNSWFNYIKQISVGMTKNHASGDDAMGLIGGGKVDLRRLADLYKKKFGADINVKKNWQSYRYTEYLKTVYDESGAYGYPSRIFSSLIWADKELEVEPSAKLYTLAEIWLQFFEKMRVQPDIAEVSRDLSRAVAYKLKGFDASVARDWLYAASSHGGFGLRPNNMKEFHFKSGGVDFYYENSLIRLPPRRWLNTFSWSTSIWEDKGGSFNIGTPPGLSEICSLDDWERRLNMEDLPVPRKYKRDYHSLIPLPRIIGVSTEFMSKLARHLRLYRYPNFKTGTSQTVKNRYFNAQQFLVKYLMDFKSRYKLKMIL